MGIYIQILKIQSWKSHPSLPRQNGGGAHPSAGWHKTVQILPVWGTGVGRNHWGKQCLLSCFTFLAMPLIRTGGWTGDSKVENSKGGTKEEMTWHSSLHKLKLLVTFSKVRVFGTWTMNGWVDVKAEIFQRFSRSCICIGSESGRTKWLWFFEYFANCSFCLALQARACMVFNIFLIRELFFPFALHHPPVSFGALENSFLLAGGSRLLNFKTVRFARSATYTVPQRDVFRCCLSHHTFKHSFIHKNIARPWALIFVYMCFHVCSASDCM